MKSAIYFQNLRRKNLNAVFSNSRKGSDSFKLRQYSRITGIQITEPHNSKYDIFNDFSYDHIISNNVIKTFVAHHVKGLWIWIFWNVSRVFRFAAILRWTLKWFVSHFYEIDFESNYLKIANNNYNLSCHDRKLQSASSYYPKRVRAWSSLYLFFEQILKSRYAPD